MSLDTFQPRERHSIICCHEGALLTIRLRDPQSGAAWLSPPGGGRLTGETGEQAAIREVREETGYQVTITEQPPVVVEYDYFWQGRHRPCRGYFYQATLQDVPVQPVDDASYVEATVWLPLTDYEAAFAYHERLRWALRSLLAA
jgi:8-oxo-dGTP pyrophosphatase MutT (NUDIX family)